MRGDYVVMSEVTFRGPRGPVFPRTNWRLPAGERWAIRGNSGAGKSLFVAALTGRLPRLAGFLRHPFLEGRPRCADSVFGVLPPGTIAVASMDQHRSLLAAREFHQLRWHGSLSSGTASVADYLCYDAVTRRNPYALDNDNDGEAARFHGAQSREITRWELEPLLNRPLLALSNGELHRLLVARALMLDPALLVVDDPYAGLDLRTRDLLTDNLAALSSAGTAVLYVAARDEDVPPTVTRELELSACEVVHVGPRRSRADAPVAHTDAGYTDAGYTDAGYTDAGHTANGQEGASQSTVLEMRGISIRQNGVAILEGVDFTVRSGERWALVGPNGAGKSTLLSLILADNPQSHSNHVVVCGRRLGPGTSIWDLKRCVGWVSPELDAHYPAATRVMDAVTSGFSSSLGMYATLGAKEQVAAGAWLERLGLARWANEWLGDLPRLERRVVLLARACVHSPKLLLLDEPCQRLDDRDRARFARALQTGLAELGVALVYVTHESAELPPGIDHVLRLQAGRVVH